MKKAFLASLLSTSFFLSGACAFKQIIADNELNQDIPAMFHGLNIDFPSDKNKLKEMFNHVHMEFPALPYNEVVQEKIWQTLALQPNILEALNNRNEQLQNFLEAKDAFIKGPEQSIFGKRVDVLTVGTSNYDGILEKFKAIDDRQKAGKLVFKEIVFISGAHKTLERFNSAEQFVRSVQSLYPAWEPNMEAISSKFAEINNAGSMLHRDALEMVLEFSPLNHLMSKVSVFPPEPREAQVQSLYGDFFASEEVRGKMILDVSTNFVGIARHNTLDRFAEAQDANFMGTWIVPPLDGKTEFALRGLTARSEILDFITKILRHVYLGETS